MAETCIEVKVKIIKRNRRFVIASLLEGGGEIFIPQYIHPTSFAPPLLESGSVIFLPELTSIAFLRLESGGLLYAPVYSAPGLKPPTLISGANLFAPTLERLLLPLLQSGASLFAPDMSAVAQGMLVPRLLAGGELFAPTLTNVAPGEIIVPRVESGGSVYAPAVTPVTAGLNIPRLEGGATLYSPVVVSSFEELLVPRIESGGTLYAPTVLAIEPVLLEVPRIVGGGTILSPTYGQQPSLLEVPILGSGGDLLSPDYSVTPALLTPELLEGGGDIYSPTVIKLPGELSMPLLESGGDIYSAEFIPRPEPVELTVPLIQGGGQVYSPELLAGIAALFPLFWYRASELALTEGADVAVWTDLTDNGYDLASNGVQTYRTNEINGKAAVEFEVGSSMTVNANAVHEDFTVFMVAKVAADAAPVMEFRQAGTGEATRYAGSVYQSGVGGNIYGTFGKIGDASYSVPNISPPTPGGYNILTVRKRAGQHLPEMYIDASSQIVGDGGGAGTSAYQGTTRTIHIGPHAGTGPAHVAEVIFFAKSLSDTQVAEVHDLLKIEYDLPGPRLLTPPLIEGGGDVYAMTFTPGITLPPDPGADHIWAADDITGLVDNDPIVTWADAGTGTPRDGTGNGPLYKTGIQNGLPGVFFDGINDWVDLGTALTSESLEYTVVAVFKPSAVAQRGCVITSLHTSGANTDSKLWIEQGAAGETPATPYQKLGYSFGNDIGAYSWGYTSANHLAAGVAVCVTLRRVTGNNYEEIYVNGVLAALVKSQTGATASHTASHLTALGRMGAWAQAYFHGHILEVRIENSALATVDREAQEDYLIAKWGIV